jgi:hypothetical protein
MKRKRDSSLGSADCQRIEAPGNMSCNMSRNMSELDSGRSGTGSRPARIECKGGSPVGGGSTS